MEQKPMIIAIEETEQMLVGAVNTALASGVSPYFLKMIFDKVYLEVNDLAKNEMSIVKANWEKQVAEKKESEIPSMPETN